MKIRNGFVSNSSSSSFIIVTTKEVADKVKESLSPYERVVVEYLEETPAKFCETAIVMYSGTSGNYDSFEYFNPKEHGYKKGSDENEECGPHDAWDRFKTLLEKEGAGKIIKHRIES